MSEHGGSRPQVDRMPVIFAGHGSPMNAVEQNEWSRGFSALRDHAPGPRAILAISAHWFVDGTYLTANDQPRTIHDFSGFPPQLSEIRYPAPGSPDLARDVRTLLGDDRAGLESGWGLDHGTWSVLRWMFPDAEIPVVQLSIDRRLDTRGHLELAASLSELREEGILIFSSGNIVHNLRDAFARRRADDEATPDWARRFDETVSRILESRDTGSLLEVATESDDGRMSHPSPDHWLPLIYAYGATDEQDQVSFPTVGFDWGSLSMRNVVFS